MAMFLAQIYMNNYFRRQNEPSDWEAIFSDGQHKPPATKNYLRMARHDFIVMSFSALFSLVLFLFGLSFVGVFLLAL
jgi:hypothetical protein